MAMRQIRFTRRNVLKGSSALAATTLFASPVKAAAPEPTAITPALIEAARKEGKVIYYTSIDLSLAEKIAKAFEAKFPGIAMRVERTGAERVFQRIGQEYASNIHAVDVVNSSDASHFIVWKRDGILAPLVPEDVAKFYRAEHKDADGMFASFRITLSVIAYNTNLVTPEDAPKGFADLLDPKWAGQDSQVASRLQRQHDDGDIPDGARSWLGIFREARQAARNAGAVSDRSA
jgi:iron(III) transport system substrate-binding protein